MKNKWDGLPLCSTCNKSMRKKKFKLEGFMVRGWECPKCNEAILLQEDAQEVLILNKLKQGIPIKVGVLGQSLIMRFPKQAEEFYHIKKGEQVILKAENAHKLEIMLPERHR